MMQINNTQRETANKALTGNEQLQLVSTSNVLFLYTILFDIIYFILHQLPPNKRCVHLRLFHHLFLI